MREAPQRIFFRFREIVKRNPLMERKLCDCQCYSMGGALFWATYGSDIFLVYMVCMLRFVFMQQMVDRLRFMCKSQTINIFEVYRTIPHSQNISFHYLFSCSLIPFYRFLTSISINILFLFDPLCNQLSNHSFIHSLIKSFIHSIRYKHFYVCYRTFSLLCSIQLKDDFSHL